MSKYRKHLRGQDNGKPLQRLSLIAGVNASGLKPGHHGRRGIVRSAQQLR